MRCRQWSANIIALSIARTRAYYKVCVCRGKPRGLCVFVEFNVGEGREEGMQMGEFRRCERAFGGRNRAVCELMAR